MSYLRHEENWIPAVITVLANGGTGVPTANLQFALSEVTAATPRIAVRAVNVARASEHMNKVGATYFHDHFTLDLETSIVTRRIDSGQNHGAIVARVRELYSYEARKFVPPALTWYQLLEITETGSARSVEDAEQREDVTLLTHRIEYAIPAASVTF